MTTDQGNDSGIEKVEGNTITINDADKFSKHLTKVAGKKSVKELYDFQYNFTDEEMQLKAKQLARANRERNELEDQKKSVTADFKAKVDSKSAEINLISGHITNGYEWLSKSCDVTKDYEKGLKEYWYDGVKVGDQKLKASDYQLDLEIAEKNNSAEATRVDELEGNETKDQETSNF